MPDVTPPLAAVEQAMHLAGPDATVQTMQALPGGTHAHTTLIQTANPETEVVLREFPPFDDAAQRETRVLRALGGLDGLAPQLLASDPAHETSGNPWVLISRLPGSADITPGDPAVQAGQLGRTLARIHQTPLHRLADLPSVFGRPDGALTGVSGPAASIVAASWDILASTPRASPTYSSTRTSEQPDQHCLIRSCGICGPSPDLTRRSRPGYRTTATSAGPT